MNEYKLTSKHIQLYADHLRLEEKGAATIEKYLRDVRAFGFWLDGREISKENTAAWKAHLVEQGYAPASVNAMLSALNSLLEFLGLRACRVKFLKIQRRMFRDDRRDLTRADYNALTAAAKERGKARLALLMEAICATGIRVSELRFISAEAVCSGRAEVCNKGKRRTVFLPDRLRRLLKAYLKKQKITAGAVFVTRTGRPLDRSNIWRAMKALCKSAGVEPSKVFPHNLRHLFARAYYALEKDLARLADILGHSSINTTRIYTMESGAVHARQISRVGLVIT